MISEEYRSRVTGTRLGGKLFLQTEAIDGTLAAKLPTGPVKRTTR